jgi:hypothetical protein
MKALRFLAKTGSDYPLTRRHIPQEENPCIINVIVSQFKCLHECFNAETLVSWQADILT